MRGSAAEAIAITMSVRYSPALSPEHIVDVFRSRSVPRGELYIFEEFFYETKRIGTHRLKRLMTENDLSIEDVRATYMSMDEHCRCREFDEVLTSGTLE